MVFLAALLAWLASLSLTAERLPGAALMRAAVVRVVQRLGGGTAVLLAVVFVPALLAALLLWWLDLWLVSLLAGFAVLVFAFGPGDQADRLQTYRQYQADGDTDRAYQLAVASLGLPEGLYERGPAEMDRALKHGLAYLLFQRFFISLFWYVAFGVPGVIMSSSLAVAQPVFRGEPAGPLALQLSHAINWFPVRLLALTLALVGNFAQSFAIWLRRVRDFEFADRALLASTVRSALPGDPAQQRPEDLLLLIKRAQILWLVVLALFTIFG